MPRSCRYIPPCIPTRAYKVPAIWWSDVYRGQVGKPFPLGSPFAAKFVQYPIMMSDSFCLHCHEQGGPTLLTACRRSDVEDMADFVIDYGRKCLDAGADVFVDHGPELPLAVEIYNGKPLRKGEAVLLPTRGDPQLKERDADRQAACNGRTGRCGCGAGWVSACGNRCCRCVPC
jgi:Bacterial capsule synthesis protein PGA_cap